MTEGKTEPSRQREQALSLMPELMRQLREYPRISGKEKGKRMLRRLCGRKNDPIDRFFWVHGMIAEALIQAHRTTGEEQYLLSLRQYADRYLRAGCPVYYVDQTMNGRALLHLARCSGKEEYRQAADKLEKFVLQSRAETAQYLGSAGVHDDGASIIYRKGNPTHVYADALGMMCPFLAEKGKESARAAQAALLRFLQMGMDEDSGLPYHGYDLKTGEKMGIIGWGRAVGWLMMGLAAAGGGNAEQQSGAAEDKENALQRQALSQTLEDLTQRVFAWQRTDGLFAWQLQAIQGPPDTSASAMIIYAVKRAICAGVLPKDMYAERIGRCESGLIGCICEGKVDRCLAECRGFSQYPQIYGSYPWGTAMTAAALLTEG